MAEPSESGSEELAATASREWRETRTQPLPCDELNLDDLMGFSRTQVWTASMAETSESGSGELATAASKEY